MAQETYVAPVVVLTPENKFLQDCGDYVVCSADMLADALVILNGEAPAPPDHKEMQQWLCSI